jgi:hypothetical protein
MLFGFEVINLKQVSFGNIAGCQTPPFVFLFVQWLYFVCPYNSPEQKADPGTQVSLEILK